jgi:hypothetical protein
MGTACFCVPVSYIPSSTHLIPLASRSEMWGTSLRESKSETSSPWLLCTWKVCAIPHRHVCKVVTSTCSHAHLATLSTFHLIGCQWFIDAHLAMCNLHSHLFLSVCRSPVHISWSRHCDDWAADTVHCSTSKAMFMRRSMAWRQSPPSQDAEHRTTSRKTVVIQHQDRWPVSAKFSVKGITATVMALEVARPTTKRTFC